MGSITFLFSLLGRHGDRGGDLHRQRDQKRTEHVLCQEQGECFTFCISAEKMESCVICVLSFWVTNAFNVRIYV